MADKEKKSKSNSKNDNCSESENIYINRELSWMAFNLRVLQEAADTSVPLLERLKFLMIYQSNLEEFYRVRIGILTHRVMLTPDKRDTVSGMLPETEIDEILCVTREQQIMMESVWKAIREELHINKIDVLDYFDFDIDKCKENIAYRNPMADVFEICGKYGRGIHEVSEYIRKLINDWRK